jgi:hypothetical protein
LSGDSAPHFTTPSPTSSAPWAPRSATIQGRPAHLRPSGAQQQQDVRHRRRQAATQRQHGQDMVGQRPLRRLKLPDLCGLQRLDMVIAAALLKLP